MLSLTYPKKKVLSVIILLLVGLFFIPTALGGEVNSPFKVPTAIGIDELSFPYGVAYSEKLDALIIADMQNHRISSFDLNNMKLTTIAGKSSGEDRLGFPTGGYVDGKLEDALFNRPRGIAVGQDGAIYVADTGNHGIRRIYEGKVTTFAGGKTSGYKEGKGVEASFLFPSGITIDKEGNIFVADTLNNVIRKIDKKAEVTTFAGKKEDTEIFNEPVGLAFDKDGNLYVADGGNHQIKMITPNGKVQRVAGNTSVKDLESGYSLGGYLDATGDAAYFNFPKAIAINEKGMIFVADSYNHVLRGIDGNKRVSTLGGKGSAGTAIGGIWKSEFDSPVALVWGRDTLFVADHWNNRIIAIPGNDKYLAPLVKTQEEGIPVYLNGRETIFPDVKAFILEDRVRVPIRAIVEAWGGQVEWSEASRSFTVERAGKTVDFQESQGEFISHENRSLVQLRTLGEKLGLKVEWLEERLVSIRDSSF